VSAALVKGPAPQNNEMNQTNREVPGMKEWRASGEPVLAEVGAPFILSLGIAGYLSVSRHYEEPCPVAFECGDSEG
jgi:hypothetical protein